MTKRIIFLISLFSFDIILFYCLNLKAHCFTPTALDIPNIYIYIYFGCFIELYMFNAFTNFKLKIFQIFCLYDFVQIIHIYMCYLPVYTYR